MESGKELIEQQSIDLRDRDPRKRQRVMHKSGGIVPRREQVPEDVNDARAPGGATAFHFHNPGDAPAGTTVSDDGGTKIGNKLFPLTLQCLFWGNAWTQPATSPSWADIMRSIITILQSDYLSGLAQYGVTGPFLLFGPAKIITAPEPPNPFGSGDVSDIIWNAIDAGSFKEPDDDGQMPALYMVFMPPGVNGPAGVGGRHSVAYDYDFPADVDQQDHGWVLFGSLDFITITFSHELVEALTDPTGDGVQVNPRNGSNWNEIGDVCVSSGRVHGVAVTSYFSGQDRACIIPSYIRIGIKRVRWHPDHVRLRRNHRGIYRQAGHGGGSEYPVDER